nr:MAG TPA: minor capsid protein [Caudoviricetes sp.]
MKKRILEILLIFGLIILEKMGKVSFFQAIIIYISAIAGDIIIQKLEVIIGLLKEIKYKLEPHHINCRHSINPYFDEEGEKENVRL